MERNADRWVTIILLIGEASGVFAGFCPSWFTVASPFFHEQEAKAGNVKRIRAGEIAATGIVLATGAAVSYSMKDPDPSTPRRLSAVFSWPGTSTKSLTPPPMTARRLSSVPGYVLRRANAYDVATGNEDP